MSVLECMASNIESQLPAIGTLADEGEDTNHIILMDFFMLKNMFDAFTRKKFTKKSYEYSAWKLWVIDTICNLDGGNGLATSTDRIQNNRWVDRSIKVSWITQNACTYDFGCRVVGQWS